MAARTVFVPNPAFLVDGSTRAFLQPAGDAVVDVAKELARKRTQAMADSIEGEWTQNDKGHQVFRVTIHDFKGHWHEFGTTKLAAQPMLGPAAMQVVGNLH